MRQFLINSNILFLINHPIKKLSGRGYIYPDILCGNVIIECNGDFFHCNPDMYTADFINPKTMKSAQYTWNRDKFKIDLYNKLGYNVITLWESKWRSDSNYKQKFLNQLKEYENNIQ